MHKLLCIVGPTGAGKTKRAIEEYRKNPSILVSADSRQVYRGMDIVTGKDHPSGTTIYGVDIVDPDEPCSVAVWHEAIMSPINQAWQEGKQVILVGGTGLYVKAITQGIETMSVPINQPLRDSLNALSITKLQERLKELDNLKFSSMNHSDQRNSRRLIRAIEVSHSPPSLKSKRENYDTKIIGLRCIDDSNHRYKITERVKQRIQMGAVAETKSLLSKYHQPLQSMSAIGYTSIIKFIDGVLTEAQMIDTWVSDELAYAKRQFTWFAKVKSIQWEYIDNKNYANSEN